MVRSFQDVVAQAQPGEKSAWRAVQTWQILVCRASLHRIITYGELAELLGYTDARPLAGNPWTYSLLLSTARLTSSYLPRG